ncbi:MAG: hypothetical protein ACLRFE_00865 [Clostridia bacterium]
MRIDLFKNQYKESNASKILFIDVICFLLVAILSLGICYAYMSDSADVSGDATTAHISIQYQYSVGDNGAYTAVNNLYGSINNGTIASIDGKVFVPGDSIVIVGRAVNTSNVSAYVLAKLEINYTRNGNVYKEEVWYNIGSNEPVYDEDGKTIVAETPNALASNEYKKLYTAEMGADNEDVYQIGAGSFGANKYKDLAIPYQFDGEKFTNGDVINSIKLYLCAHQKDYLRSASDFEKYSKYETSGHINGYTTESIYASHYITGKEL